MALFYTRFVYVSMILAIIFPCSGSAKNLSKEERASNFYGANHSFIQYTGRVDFSNNELPRFWAPGVYIEAWFRGENCEITLNDELLWGTSHNYVSIVLDDQPVQRIKLTEIVNVINLDSRLKSGNHKITICKSTESGIGYLEFAGIKCEELLEPGPRPARKIEFYGNSITCGTGSDTAEIPCGSGEWYDQHNAYMSYGPVTARLLNAQWMLSSVSGIGLMHSCCDMDMVMPDVYDKLNMWDNKIQWDFSKYQPDVVTVALGQNDGIQDSTEFCTRYVDFVHTLRGKYKDAKIILLTSPMGDETLTLTLKNYLASVTETLHKEGDENVHTFFFSRSFNNGCGGHPDLAQHQEIAGELAGFLSGLMEW